jgi:hypothetical protein
LQGGVENAVQGRLFFSFTKRKKITEQVHNKDKKETEPVLKNKNQQRITKRQLKQAWRKQQRNPPYSSPTMMA